MKTLVDTCIILDVLQDREGHADASALIFSYAYNSPKCCHITAKSLTDIYYLTHKATHDKALTLDTIRRLLTRFSVVDTLGIDCVMALDANMRDYEDAVMLETAIRCGMDCIITRNTADYRQNKISVYTPSEFSSLYGNRG